MADLLTIGDVLSPKIIELIRNESAVAEQAGKLTGKQLQLINEKGWFKALAPSVYSGKQSGLPDVVKLEEALSYADGSFGWLVTLCAGAGWFGGFMDEEFAKQAFASSEACIAGSGGVNGKAEKNGNDYIVTGKWPYASGAPFATVFTANCAIYENDKPVLNEQGKQQVRSFCFLKNEVKIYEEWNAIGLVATASHSFEVKNLKVDKSRTFDSNEPPVVTNGLYHFPFMQLAECTLAANMLGMGQHFMELIYPMIREKYANDATANDKYEVMSNKLQTARQKLYYGVDMAWQVCNANKDVSQSMLYKVSAASYNCISVVKDCVSMLFPYSGLRGADKATELNRVWRDIQTAGQHSLLVGAVNV